MAAFNPRHWIATVHRGMREGAHHRPDNVFVPGTRMLSYRTAAGRPGVKQ
jgi:hypothetical protein